MAQVDLYNTSGSVIGKKELNDNIFAIEPNKGVVHSVVVQYLANQRQGNKSTLTRAEVRGGGAKPRPQKGTGRSRQGSIRSPQWTGGGVVFAPKPRDFSFKINKKVKRLALKSVLSSKLLENKILVLDNLELNEIKTKEMAKILDNIKAKKALIVTDGVVQNVVLSARNLPNVKTSPANVINVYDILKYDYFIATSAAIDKIEEVFA